MLKRMFDWYLSPKMGWIIYASFLFLIFPQGAAQGVAYVFWALCMELAMVRSLLLLAMDERRQISHWHRGFGIGLFMVVMFLLSWVRFGNRVVFSLSYPVTAWTNLEKLMFVR